jgi:trimethyllysine dioxygenase
MADTAYTNIALPAHTDTTYFDDPAGLQAFHMLSHEPDATSTDPKSLGGESLLVDGFNAALELKSISPRAYKILAEVPLPWHASGNKGIAITPERTYPVFERAPGNKVLLRIRWNNDDRGVVPFHPGCSPVDWYDAAREWNALLEDKRFRYWEQLKPGRTLSMHTY